MFSTNGFRVYEHSGVVLVVQHSLLLVFSTNGFRVYEHSGMVLLVSQQQRGFILGITWVLLVLEGQRVVSITGINMGIKCEIRTPGSLIPKSFPKKPRT